MTNIRDLLAKNMKAYRRALGLSQAKLAERANTSTHYIGMIETKNKFPSPEMLERLALALGIDTIEMFSEGSILPEALKDYRKAALEDVRELVEHFIDEKLKDLGKET